jgi:hypothetical protein
MNLHFSSKPSVVRQTSYAVFRYKMKITQSIWTELKIQTVEVLLIINYEINHQNSSYIGLGFANR